jgi:hypothetical protein
VPGVGDWVLTVDLEEGDNDLVFRIGDEEATTPRSPPS